MALALGAPVVADSETVDVRPAVRVFPSWPIALLAALVIARAVIYASAIVFESWPAVPDRVIPAWAQILQAGFFASQAVILLYFGRADRRAWSLGVFILDVACTLVEPFVRTVAPPSPLLAFALQIRTDAFQAAMLWFFASEFPRVAARPRLAIWFWRFTATAFVLGLGLLTANIFTRLYAGEDSPGPLLQLANQFSRDKPGFSDWYFAPQFLLLVPLLVVVPLKLRESGADDRRRFSWLLAGLGLGFAPIMLEVFLASLWPAYPELARPYLALRGLVIISALTLVPTAAAYAALVQRTLDLRLVVRAAVQYVLARSVVRALAAAPVLMMAMVLFRNRERSIVAVLSGRQGGMLVALSIAGFAAAFWRRRLLHWLDTRFFREQVDARQTLIDLADTVRRASTVAELCELARESVARALHPSAFVAAVAGDAAFYTQEIDLPPLERSSALAQLIAGGGTPLPVDERPGSLMARLGTTERRWLARSHARLLVAMKGGAGQLVGILALGEKKSQLPYSAEDKTLLSAVGDACGLALDRLLAGERDIIRESSDLGVNPAARECPDCGELKGIDHSTCSCGALLARAPVPLVLDDRLRFSRRIGAGGMGVVYRAVDLRLRQPRAVKTLPRIEPAMVARLRREARAMAAANHPNLATLYGLEIWQGSPLLVMEFLDGGTLADRLRVGPLGCNEALSLGATLADGLGALHSAGTVHRDVKPSNVGFTANGVPKLLDFGLAKLLPQSALDGTGSTTLGEGGDSGSFSTEPGGIRGTPPYLSPEVLSGKTPSPSDDLWSLSVTLLEACSGRNPFRASTVAGTISIVLTERERAAAAAAAGLPARMQQLFLRLLGSIEHRPDSAHTLATQLRALIGSGG
jgi:hypothetical protein